MGVFDLFLMAVGVSMDAAAVSICKGMSIPAPFQWKPALRVALYFGFFQGLMPMIGYALGANFRLLIQAWDHWIAFVLLTWIGIGMLRASREKKKPSQADFSHAVLFPLAIATSIDALALGISLAFLNVNIILGSLMMLGVTFLVCLFATYLGYRFRSRFASAAEVLGGVALIFLGLKILAEHLLT